MKDIEIEITVQIENSESLKKFLEKEAEFKEEKHQVDEYFTPAHKNFIKIRPVKEWLRLRNENGRSSVCYKNWYYDEEGKSSHYCDECETKVEDFSKLKKILESLGFKSLVVVGKIRRTWNYKDYEIDLDSVKGLGDFVEIEYIGTGEVETKSAINAMIKFIKSFDCGKITKDCVGYPFRLLFPEEIESEEI